MSRNSSGTYSLPSGNPVVSGNTITSTWANNTLADIRAEITDSLCRSGKGAMLAALQGYDGSVSTPGYGFGSDTDTGLYRIGANNPAMAAGGAKVQEWASTGSTFVLGVTVTQSQSNTAGVTAAGNGTAAGLAGTGGATGAGVTGAGGATSGVGGAFTATAGNSIGATGAGNGTGAGLAGTGGLTGPGVTGSGGATSGNGGTFTGVATGHGVQATAGASADAHGVVGTSGAGASSAGIKGVTSNANGVGVWAQSNAAGANGLYAQMLSGTGAATAAVYAESTASGGYAFIASGDAAGTPARAAVRIVPQAGQPATGQIGDMYMNTAGVLFSCTVAGTPGTWTKVGTQT